MSHLTISEQLRERFNNPLRRQLADAMSAIDLDEDPKTAWEKLKSIGLLSQQFYSDHRRRFGQHDPGQQIFPKDRPQEHLEPTSIVSVLTVGADPSGIQNAESYAREFARRLKPFTAVCNDEVVWYFTDNPYHQYPYETGFLGKSYNAIRDTVDWSLSEAGIEIEAFELGEPSERLPLLILRAIAAWEGWRIADSRKIEVSRVRWPVDASNFKEFGDKDNPFEPLLNLWLTGYRIASNFEESDPTIRLYAKPVEISSLSSS